MDDFIHFHFICHLREWAHFIYLLPLLKTPLYGSLLDMKHCLLTPSEMFRPEILGICTSFFSDTKKNSTTWAPNHHLWKCVASKPPFSSAFFLLLTTDFLGRNTHTALLRREPGIGSPVYSKVKSRWHSCNHVLVYISPIIKLPGLGTVSHVNLFHCYFFQPEVFKYWLGLILKTGGYENQMLKSKVTQ